MTLSQNQKGRQNLPQRQSETQTGIQDRQIQGQRDWLKYVTYEIRALPIRHPKGYRSLAAKASPCVRVAMQEAATSNKRGSFSITSRQEEENRRSTASNKFRVAERPPIAMGRSFLRR